MNDFTIESLMAQDAAVLNARGKLTVGVGDSLLRDAVRGALRAGSKTITLNLQGIQTVDSAGVGELVSTYTLVTNRGGKLALAGLPRGLSDILQITQLISVFQVFDTAEEAIRDVVQDRKSARELLGRIEEALTLDGAPPDLYLASEDVPTIIHPVLVEGTELLLQRLAREPESLYELTPRRFEEVIASLIESMGWKVHLTPASKDGGRDIVALLPTELGHHLCLVEAKRYGQSRKVGVGLVRQLYGAVNHEEATSGLMVTSSFYTRGAEAFAATHKHRMSLKDYRAVVAWIREHDGKGKF